MGISKTNGELGPRSLLSVVARGGQSWSMDMDFDMKMEQRKHGLRGSLLAISRTEHEVRP